MKRELMNLFLFIIICFVVYYLFRNFNYNLREGMTDASGNTITASDVNAASSNGIAGNASAYGATLKSETIKMQDMFLVSKYRTDYETVVLNLDDLINNLMLKTALTIDKTNPDKSISKLAEMNQAKAALNNVMKFIDRQQ